MALLFQLQANEDLVREEAAIWMKGGLSNSLGRLFLTNQRLIFARYNPFLGPLLGLLGMLFSNWFKKVTIDLPLHKISSFEHSSFGFNKKVILFHTAEGDFKIGVNRSFEEWERDLKEVMKKKPRLV